MVVCRAEVRRLWPGAGYGLATRTQHYLCYHLTLNARVTLARHATADCPPPPPPHPTVQTDQ